MTEAARKEFPAMRYHATLGQKLVQNPDEEKALGPGWFDSPKKTTAGKAAKAKAEKTADAAADAKPAEPVIEKNPYDSPDPPAPAKPAKPPKPAKKK